MRTRVCALLGIELPIFAFSHCRDVVAAVSNAGGLGVLGASGFAPEQLETELEWLDEHTTGKPYGVDLVVPARYVGDGEGGLSPRELTALIPDSHRQFVRDLLERYAVPDVLPTDHPHDEDVIGHTEKGAQTLLEVVWPHRSIRLIANALGPAPAHLVTQAHQRGILVAGLVGTVEHARRQVAAGVDLVVAQGHEAGGHTGEIGSMVLIPQVVDAVAPTPVVAAGGIANGRQIAAALALGAEGVWCGSVWLACEEAETHPVVKQKLLLANSSDTVRSRSRTGKPARQLRSAWTDEWEAEGSPEPLAMPLQSVLTADADRRIARSAASNEGAQQLINYFVGQVVGQLDQIEPVRRVVYEMVEEYITAAGQVAATIAETEPPAQRTPV